MVHATSWLQSTSTPRMYLRPVNPSHDAGDVHRMRANPAVSAYIHPSFVPAPTLTAVESNLSTTAASNKTLLALTLRPTPAFAPFQPIPAHPLPSAWQVRSPAPGASAAHTDRADQAIVGTVGISSTHELGFVVDEPFWGMGLATEAVRAAVVAWKETVSVDEWRQLKAVTNVENVACVRVLEKSGFERTGSRVIEGWEGEEVELVEFRLRGKGQNESLAMRLTRAI